MIDQIVYIINNATLELPALEVSLSLAVLSICLIFKLTRFGLIFAYLLCYRWGWFLFIGESEKYMTAYLLFGTITGILTVIGMITSKESEK